MISHPTPDKAVAAIPRGSTIFLEQGACEPTALKGALCARIPADARLVMAPVTALNEWKSVDADVLQRLNAVVFVGTPDLGQLIESHAIDYVPAHWSEVGQAIQTRFRPDVALVKVSRPDSEGYVNLGANASFELAVISSAHIVIAEISDEVPVVSGDTRLHLSQINHSIESPHGLCTASGVQWGEVEERIARLVVDLLPDQSTIQIGSGNVPDAVMARIAELGTDIRFHSGILTDPVAKFIARMADAGREVSAVAGMLIGTTWLYDYARNNDRITLRTTSFTHSQDVLSRIARFVAINSAIEVDLLGQVNAEYLPGSQVAGVGGQLDFFRGARSSAGGLAIIAMPSETRTRSRIVEAFSSGTPISTPRVDVDFIVTEHGVAEMRNRSVRERMESLIRIAAPKYRAALRKSSLRSVG